MTAWTKPTGERTKALSAGVRAQIDEYAAEWEPPIPLEPQQTEKLRALLRAAPRRVGEARVAGSALMLSLLWWYDAGREFDLQRMLHPIYLSSFRDDLALEGYAEGTLNAYIRVLDRMGQTDNAKQSQEWKTMNQTPTVHRHYQLPYDDEEERGCFLLAWAQPTVRLRDGLLALLYLTLGVGLYEGKVCLVRSTDVRRDDDGNVVVRVGETWRMVRPRYAEGLIRLVERAGDRVLVPGAYGKEKTSRFMYDLIIPEGTLKPSVARLVATYRWWVDDQYDLADVVEQCGGPNVLVHLADLHRQIPRHSRGFASWLDPADDLEDGPWMPDWAARHHRP